MSIHKKIQQVMQKVPGVTKDSFNKHGSFKYAGHEAVNEALRGHFAELGIVRTARMLSCQVLDGGTILAQCEISYTDVDDPTAPLVVPMWAVQPSQTSNKTVTAQQIGQALSYATKNVEFKLFALTGDGEADSDSSEAYNPNEEPAAAPSAAVKRAEQLLRTFEQATTEATVLEVNALFKAEWTGNLDAVPGLAQRVSDTRNAALRRIRGV